MKLFSSCGLVIFLGLVAGFGVAKANPVPLPKPNHMVPRSDNLWLPDKEEKKASDALNTRLKREWKLTTGYYLSTECVKLKPRRFKCVSQMALEQEPLLTQEWVVVRKIRGLSSKPKDYRFKLVSSVW
jgi:hypothetical protein